MDCPKCKSKALSKRFGNPSLHCPECNGIWVTARHLGQMSDTLTVDVATTGADGTTHDDKTGLCPEGHGIMVRAKIDVEDPFYLEKCTHCGGIWFDSGEWQQIAQHQLIESLADYWTLAWQRKHKKEKNEQVLIDMHKKVLGDEIFDHIMALAASLRDHPEKTRALALLRQAIHYG